jgi:hypothetical protein
MENCTARKDASLLLITIQVFVKYIVSYYSEDIYILSPVLRAYFAGITAL